MSGQFWLDWLALAISLFNTVVLAWLGLTVLFNAERRTWGVFLAVGGMLAGAAFFLSHSVVVSQGASALIQNFGFWWQVGWMPLVAAPYLWYLLMLWYSGYWDEAQSHLRRRQRVWFWLPLALALLMAGLLLAANPLPDISYEANVQVERLPSMGSVPLISLTYPLYIVLCIGLALDALLRPAPSGRVMGDLARRRARPWLVSASLVLLLVSLLVGLVIAWLLQVSRGEPSIANLIVAISTPLSVIDLLLAGLLMVAILLLGQAIVSYEIFTGKTLPRRGFLHLWRNTVILMGAICLLSAWEITRRAPQVFTVLAVLALVVFSYTLFSWQSFNERERSIRQLRPLVTSQRLFESMLQPLPVSGSETDLTAPFSALCQEVLGARRALLVPLGWLAALGGKALQYPPEAAIETPALGEVISRFSSAESPGLPLDPERYGGMIWAAPLWSERGLTGVLLLAEKSDGGYYSLEEIEIARASGERLADIQASAEMARRLIALQRQRLAESQVMDQQTRRILHDDVLPRLHAAMLELSGSQPEPNRTVESLGQVHRLVADLLQSLPRPAAPQVARLGVFGALREVLDVELKDAFDEVGWDVPAEVELRARGINAVPAEVIYYAGREALRNAARHARRESPNSVLRLNVSGRWRRGLEIVIEDNGVGLGESRSSGGGQGLTLHSTMMAVVNGSLALESTPGEHTRLILRLPEESLP
jgi:signal transduction histidine kinase